MADRPGSLILAGATLFGALVGGGLAVTGSVVATRMAIEADREATALAHRQSGHAACREAIDTGERDLEWYIPFRLHHLTIDAQTRYDQLLKDVQTLSAVCSTAANASSAQLNVITVAVVRDFLDIVTGSAEGTTSEQFDVKKSTFYDAVADYILHVGPET